MILTHWGLVMPYGYRDLGQHWLRWWLVAWWHQAITWTNVDWSSLKSSDTHNRAISQEMPQPSITKICLIITYLKFHSNFPGANELIHYPGSCKARLVDEISTNPLVIVEYTASEPWSLSCNNLLVYYFTNHNSRFILLIIGVLMNKHSLNQGECPVIFCCFIKSNSLKVSLHGHCDLPLN